jgi:hypothetical protein
MHGYDFYQINLYVLNKFHVGLHKLHCIEMLNGVADTVKAVLTKPPWEQLLCAE